MSVEKNFIEIMDRILPKDRASPVACFEADAQIIRLGAGTFVFSTDGFSHEDLLQEHDPCRLGWNVAVGAISDILAIGGVPLFYAHAMSIERKWNADFVEKFSRGVARALELSGITFIGGDLGVSGEWKYAASVIGRLEGEPVLRKGASEGDSIYLSGEIGTGNLEAAMSLFARRSGFAAAAGRINGKFHLRLCEARLMRRYATSSIDTSDGVFDALNTLSEASGLGYFVENLPYLRRGVLLAKLLAVPPSLLFFGGCGEYELLFTIKREQEAAFLSEAREKGMKFYRLGKMTGPQRILKEDGACIDLSQAAISARDFATAEEYMEELLSVVEGLRCQSR